MAKDMVMEGDYKGKGVMLYLDGIHILAGIRISKHVLVNKDTIEKYEVIDKGYDKPGIFSDDNREYTIAVKFKDGKSCIMQVGQRIYLFLVQMFLD